MTRTMTAAIAVAISGNLRIGISVEVPLSPRAWVTPADGERVVQDYGAVQVAAEKEEEPGGYANPRQQHDHRQGVERRTVGEVIDTKRERSENDGNAGGDKARPEGVAENGVEQDPAHDDLGDRDDEHLRECARQDDRISQIDRPAKTPPLQES